MAGLRVVTACMLAALAAGCADNQQYGPAANACTTVVKTYLDLPNVVAILTAKDEGGGTVRIRYESTDAMNLPVRGEASCAFTGGVLTAATVGDAALPEDALAGMNRILSQPTQ